MGAIPLLERSLGSGPGGQDQWQTCPVSDINHELSKCYGLPIEFDRKLSGLQVVARALSRGDVIHAQIATVHLGIPTPPVLTKSVQTAGEIIDLASQLSASALLKEDWDPAQHPRWPAGSPDSIGGQFAPADAISDASADDESSDAPVIPVQITIPVHSIFQAAFRSPLKSFLRQLLFPTSIRGNLKSLSRPSGVQGRMGERDKEM